VERGRIANGDNTLIIKDSDLADNAFSAGNAKIIIENSNAAFLRARDNVEMTIKNSVINGDVIAENNGKITLINTKIRGQTVKKGNGKIIYLNL